MSKTSERRADLKPPNRWTRLGVALAGLALGFAVVAVSSCRGGKPETMRPMRVEPGALAGWNVLLVSLDTVRADRVGCYGYASAATPTLDALAAAGVRCDHAIAPAPLTLPSHASLLTGLNPHHHGARTNGMFRVGDEIVTLAELLKSHGYATGAVISAYVLDRRYGLAQGFDDYADDLTAGNKASKFGYRERIAAQTNEVALQWLGRHARDRFFLWVHYFDPHSPYAPPEPYRSRFANRPYDGEIAYADEQLDRLLTALDEAGVRGRTLVVVVGDHGESLGEHQELTHGIMIYDATMRVPMIWSAPGAFSAGQVIGRQVGLIDVVPTILDLLGVKAPAGLDGQSLARPWQTGLRELYIEGLGSKLQCGWAPLVGIRRNDCKFILAPRPELYDLQADPSELNNLFVQRRQVAEKFHERLRAVLGSDPHLVADVRGNLPLDAESREKLKGLSYVFESGKGATTRRALPDPKDMIGDWHLRQRAQALADRGEHRKTIEMLEAHLETRPNDVRSWQVIADSYRATGRRDRALAAFRREKELAYRKVEARVGIGSILLEMGKIDEARAAFQRALEEDPQSHGAVFGLGTVSVRQNRPDEALERFEQSIKMARGSTTAAAHFNVGAIHYAKGQPDVAREAFEASLASDPGFSRAARALAEMERQAGRKQEAAEVLRRSLDRRANAGSFVALGGLLTEMGQTDAAVAAFMRALALRPDLPAGRLQLGVLLAGAKRFAEAEKHLREVVRLAPKSAAGHYNLGVLLAMQDRFTEAVEAFQRTIELNPRHAGAHNSLGQALMSLGRTQKAATHFRHALRIDPNLVAARENLQPCTTAPAATQSRPASTRSSH